MPVLGPVSLVHDLVPEAGLRVLDPGEPFHEAAQDRLHPGPPRVRRVHEREASRRARARTSRALRSTRRRKAPSSCPPRRPCGPRRSRGGTGPRSPLRRRSAMTLIWRTASSKQASRSPMARAVAGEEHLAHEHAVDPHLVGKVARVPEPAVGVAGIVVEGAPDPLGRRAVPRLPGLLVDGRRWPCPAIMSSRLSPVKAGTSPSAVTWVSTYFFMYSK